MYICVCNAVTDSDIQEAVDGGVRNLKQLTRETGCSSSCGCCKEMALEVLQQAVTEKRQRAFSLPVLQMA